MRSTRTDLAEISGVKRSVCEFAQGRGWIVRQLAWIGRRGGPDTFFARDGRVILVEFKRPGKEPGLQQAREIRRLRKHGVEVYSVNDVELGCALFT